MIIASAQLIFDTVAPYVLPVVVGAASLVLCVLLVLSAIRQIRKQIKLYNSITLVELKSAKAHYFVFFLLIAFFLFYGIMQMVDSEGFEVLLLREKLGMNRLQTVLTIGALTVVLLAIEFWLVVLIKSRSAVVDRGIYIGTRYLDWYHVHDYMIDEDRGSVILSSNKHTFATLEGTTQPLKVAKNDVPKLKFILNKNKNKFSGAF